MARGASPHSSMETRRPRLSPDELQLLRWLLGGVLMLLSIATVFYLDIDSGAMAAVAAAGVLAALARPALRARAAHGGHNRGRTGGRAGAQACGAWGDPALGRARRLDAALQEAARDLRLAAPCVGGRPFSLGLLDGRAAFRPYS